MKIHVHVYRTRDLAPSSAETRTKLERDLAALRARRANMGGGSTMSRELDERIRAVEAQLKNTKDAGGYWIVGVEPEEDQHYELGENWTITRTFSQAKRFKTEGEAASVAREAERRLPGRPYCTAVFVRDQVTPTGVAAERQALGQSQLKHIEAQAEALAERTTHQQGYPG